ncbi:MAG TPA: phosphate ABC transporter permease subunit PstC [Alphaproteobacteria bacterium]|nr:phosphate ABC transporter permease subunit PstC [Alphaproteobacteria bacterium]
MNDNVAVATRPIPANALHERGQTVDRIFASATRISAGLVLLVISAIVLSLIIGAWPAIRKFGFGFLVTSGWNPVTEQFGALVPIYGTIVTSLIAMLIGVPISFGISVFITELCPRWLKRPVGIAIELLAAIPSIIYGIWGLFIFAPLFADYVQPWVSENIGDWPIVGSLFQGPPLGIGILTAGIILAIMIIPFMSAVMRDIFEVVPSVLKESAYAMGATTWEVLRYVVLPYTKSGVVGGVMLGLGRAMGETMAVTFVIGNAYRINASLFMPGTTISSSLANEFTEAVSPIYTAVLIELGLVLFVVMFVVVSLAKFLLFRMNAKERQTA